MKVSDEYYMYSNGKLHSKCKPCTRAKSRVQSKIYYSQNAEKVIKRTGKYRKENIEKMRPWYAQYALNRRHNDEQFKIAHDLRKSISNSIAAYISNGLNGRNYKTLKNIGCTLPCLIKHFESKWKSGMSWENYGSGNAKWEVDHIIPLSSFDLKNPTEVEKANHYTNLQALWSFENKRKSDKLEYNLSKSVPQLTDNELKI